MKSLFLLVPILALCSTVWGADQAAPKKSPAQPPPFLKDTPEQFIKRFDKNMDGFLTRNEVPPFLARAFDRIDTNGDGKLDKQEIAAWLKTAQQRFGQQNGPSQAEIDRVVNGMLERMDKDKDGKISRKEAEGRPLARVFDQFDTNKDAFLDKKELRQAAIRFLAMQGGRPQGGRGQGGPAFAGPDFDALDLNADGRLTRDELKGTPYLKVFDEIDTNKDGKIDRKEFEAYLKKTAKQ
jgi:Ca2+-binding EF-hand superfamily protein